MFGPTPDSRSRTLLLARVCGSSPLFKVEFYRLQQKERDEVRRPKTGVDSKRPSHEQSFPSSCTFMSLLMGGLVPAPGKLWQDFYLRLTAAQPSLVDAYLRSRGFTGTTPLSAAHWWTLGNTGRYENEIKSEINAFVISDEVGGLAGQERTSCGRNAARANLCLLSNETSSRFNPPHGCWSLSQHAPVERQGQPGYVNTHTHTILLALKTWASI